MRRDVAAAVRNLKLKFAGEDALLFRGVSLSFRKGEHTLLLGPSGCGKSTLLQVLSGLIPRSVDVPMIADEVVVPERWGYVFQDPDTQFCMPYADEELAFALENLGVPRGEMPDRIRGLLSRVGLSLPDSHAPIGSFSQGMKQRLAIASALATEPEVLFLDEPTALLDDEGTDQVWRTIRELAAEGMTLIAVEHKIDGLSDLFGRVVVLGPSGEPIADGPPSEVFARHAGELDRFGIWHPGSWASSGFVAERPVAGRRAGGLPLLELDGFRGKRGGVPVVEAEKAVVRPGDWIGVLGANGAGKSSLLLAIMRLIRTEGVCRVAGEELRKVEATADRVSFVFQNPEWQFVTNSVRAEIEYSLVADGVGSEELAGRRDRAMAEFQLEAAADRHPFQLSTGQKRRLSVAAAVVRERPMLLLDEPTFGLDARNTFALLGWLERLRAQGTAIVMVTHDRRIAARCCTALWRVREGRVEDVAFFSAPENVASSG